MLEQSLANLEGVERYSFAAEARGRLHCVPRELWKEVMLTDSTLVLRVRTAAAPAVIQTHSQQ